MLTAQQSRLLTYIDGQLKTGICPSYVEMQSAMGLASKAGINRLLKGLECRGFIRRLPYRARAIEVIRCPVSGASSGYDAGYRAGYIAALTSFRQ